MIRIVTLAILTHVVIVVVLGWPPITHPWQFGLNCFLMGFYTCGFAVAGIRIWFEHEMKEAASRNQVLIIRRKPDPSLN